MPTPLLPVRKTATYRATPERQRVNGRMQTVWHVERNGVSFATCDDLAEVNALVQRIELDYTLSSYPDGSSRMIEVYRMEAQHGMA